jgi:Zinc finger, C2H2 type
MRPVTKNGTVCGTALQSVVHRPQITLERRPGRNVGDHGEGTFLHHFHARWQLLCGCGSPGVCFPSQRRRTKILIHSQQFSATIAQVSFGRCCNSYRDLARTLSPVSMDQHDQAGALPASEVHPMKARDTATQPDESARRVSILALVGSPHTPARPGGMGAGLPPFSSDRQLMHPPPLSIGAPASVAAPEVMGSTGPFVRPHPVKQLQGAVTKGRRNKKHVCEFPGCGREFSRKSNLEAHSRKHMTGAQATPYACQHCSRRFKWRSSLKSHEAGCMHQSLPMAIQQQQRLEQQRLEQQRLFQDEQEQRKRQRQLQTRPQVEGERGEVSQSQVPAAGLRESPLLAAARAVASSSDISSAGVESSLRSFPGRYSEAYDDRTIRGAHPVSYLERSVAQTNTQVEAPIIPPAVSRAESHGMLSSLRLPPPDLFESKPGSMPHLR